MNNSKYIPQIGDTVRLINSGDNWCDEDMEDSMTNIAERTPLVIITKVIDDTVRPNETHYTIKFDGDCGWKWATRNGHFEFYSSKKDDSHNEPLINLLKQIE